MKKITPLLLFLFIAMKSYGTGQTPDCLIYKGDTLDLFYCPLDFYPDRQYITRQRLFGGNGCFSTGCWRGYVATWELIDNELYLVEIKNYCYFFGEKDIPSYKKAGVTVGSEYADLKSLFPEKYKNGKVKADWVTGELLSPQGKLLFSINEEFMSIYEKELLFQIENGILTATEDLDNSKTRKSRYVENRELLMDFIRNNINYDHLPQSDTINRRVTISVISADDQGHIDSAEVVRSVNEIYDKEALRVVKLIPEWEVLYKKGKKISRRWVIPVNFDMKKRNKD